MTSKQRVLQRFKHIETLKIVPEPATLTSKMKITRSLSDNIYHIAENLVVADLYSFDMEILFSFKIERATVKIKPRNSALHYKIKLVSVVEDDTYTYDFNEKTRSCKNVFVHYEPLAFELHFAIEFSSIYMKEGSFITDINKHFSTSENISLIASDGVVEVKKDLLAIRSPVFEAMFSHNMLEATTREVQMKQYNSKTLAAFAKFLSADCLDNLNETASGLFMLAHQYDIPLLKAEAGSSLLNTVTENNFDEVFELIMKLQPELTKEAMKKVYVDRKNVQ